MVLTLETSNSFSQIEIFGSFQKSYSRKTLIFDQKCTKKFSTVEKFDGSEVDGSETSVYLKLLETLYRYKKNTNYEEEQFTIHTNTVCCILR